MLSLMVKYKFIDVDEITAPHMTRGHKAYELCRSKDKLGHLISIFYQTSTSKMTSSA